MKEEKKEVYWEHKWLFVIIPVQHEYWIEENNRPDTRIPAVSPHMSAYCKTCDSYYTTPLEWSPYSPREGKAGLPKYGCVGPEGL